jgi:uncharacterized protein (TIGR02996 family)
MSAYDDEQRQRFIDALARDEDDEATRLVFSDWLEERGEYEEAERQREWKSSKEWLRNFASEWNFNYSEMIRAASADGGDYSGSNYVVARGIDLHSRHELDDDEPRFWSHLSVLTGRSFDEAHREDFGWSCSC